MSNRRLGALMFLPAIVYVLAIIGVPFALAFIYSLGDVKIASVGYHFVGLQNFRSVLQSPSFRRSLYDSVVFTVGTQIIVLIGSTILALALKDRFRGRGLVRFLILLPWVAPVSLGAIGWKWILDSLYSVINWVLIATHLVRQFDAPMWLGEPSLAMMSVIGVESWRLLPFSTVILLAGLTAIPRDIPEAAAVDGAGFWRTLFQINIPMIFSKGTVRIASDDDARVTLPEKFLELILLELKNARIVESVRGAKGGYQLRRPPSQIRLSEVIRLIDGPLGAIRGFRLCSSCRSSSICFC
jgi:ABC-type sugar transport system permease subunit